MRAPSMKLTLNEGEMKLLRFVQSHGFESPGEVLRCVTMSFLQAEMKNLERSKKGGDVEDANQEENATDWKADAGT